MREGRVRHRIQQQHLAGVTDRPGAHQVTAARLSAAALAAMHQTRLRPATSWVRTMDPHAWQGSPVPL